MRLFLKSHSLEFHKIWHEFEDTLERNMPMNVQKGIIKDLSVKILLK